MLHLDAVALGAQVRITNGDVLTTTKWRDEDNVVHDLAPPQVLELWSQATGYVQAVHEAAWALKDGGSIPDDYAADAHWP